MTLPIETNFSFRHEPVSRALSSAPANLFAQTIMVSIDRLGPLRDLVGPEGKGKAARTWKGTGYNMIWRPMFPKQGDVDFFLETFTTDDTLSFTDITGPTGVANRGLLQDDIFMGSLAYQQSIDRHVDHSGQHFEVGIWINVPATDDPHEKTTVTRMGSIPHGTTINLQGKEFLPPAKLPLAFPVASIVPFVIGQPNNQIKTGPIGDAMDLQKHFQFRSPSSDIPGIDQNIFSDPNLLLKQANDHRDMRAVLTLQVASATSQGPVATVPDAGGGVDNIAFLVGKQPPAGGGANADVPTVTATLWIEHFKDPKGGADLLQLQYSQTVLLNFNGLSWPHVTVGTLTPVP